MRRALLTVVILILASSGCSPVEPPPPAVEAARCPLTAAGAPTCSPLPANVMLVVDASGSMNEPIAAGVVRTRIADLRDAMSSFLTSHGTLARFGLWTFPETGDSCAPGGLSVPLPEADDTASLQSNADAIAQQLQATYPSGGTPTAAALTALQNYAPLFDPSRRNFVILLTDGVPNCNPTIATDCNTSSCRCTMDSCAGLMCQLGCLDDAGAVAAIQSLRNNGVDTAVIGFGPEASTTAANVLEELAQAGGQPAPCDPNASRCDSFYVAEDADALTAILPPLCSSFAAQK